MASRGFDDWQRENEWQTLGAGNPGFSMGQQFPGMGMQRGGIGMSPYMLGAGISGITGNDVPGQTFNESQQDEPGAFSQLGSQIAGIPGKIGGGLQGIWGGLEPFEKAQILAAGVGGVADLYSSYKQGKLEDEERRKRQESAESLRPLFQHLMTGVR